MHDVVDESEVQSLHDMITEADDDITIGDQTTSQARVLYLRGLRLRPWLELVT